MLPSLFAPFFEKCLKAPADKLFNRIGSRDKGTVRICGIEMCIATSLVVFGCYFVISLLCNEIIFVIDFRGRDDKLPMGYVYFNATMHYLNSLTTIFGTIIIFSNYCRDKMWLANILMWLSLGLFTVTVIDILMLPVKSIVGVVGGDDPIVEGVIKWDFRWWLDMSDILQNIYNVVNLLIMLLVGKAWIDAMLSGQAIKVAGGSLFEPKNWLQIRFEKELESGNDGRIKKAISKALSVNENYFMATESLKVEKDGLKAQKSLKNQISLRHGIVFTSEEDEFEEEAQAQLEHERADVVEDPKKNTNNDKVVVPQLNTNKRSSQSSPHSRIDNIPKMKSPKGLRRSKSVSKMESFIEEYEYYYEEYDEEEEAKQAANPVLRKIVTFRDHDKGGLESQYEFSARQTDAYTETLCTESFLSWSDS